MSVQGPGQSQFQYDNSTPPPPPPKPSGHSSGRDTPLAGGPPLPPPPRASPHASYTGSGEDQVHYLSGQQLPADQVHHLQPHNAGIPAPEPGWLPPSVRQLNTADLSALLRSPQLQAALLADPETAYPSVPASNAALSAQLTANLTTATQLTDLERQLRARREATQSSLLSLRALERQWRAKQTEQDAALRDFSAPALYQRLVAAVAEGEEGCRALEESFLAGGGRMGEREVQDFVKRYREARRAAFLRRERKERWDEGRVGGWR